MKSILFKSFDLTQAQYNELLSALNSFNYSVESGEGVQVIENSADHARCIYCYEVVSAQNTYNPETGEFDKIEFKRIELIPFVVDLKYKTLDVIGNKRKCSKVVEMIGRLTKYKVPVGDSQVDPIKILFACSKLGVLYRVNRVKIEDYVFFDNIVGNCVLNLSNYDKINEVLSKYKKQIVNFSAVLILDEDYSITFYRSGAITLHKDFEELDIELIRMLKKGL